MTIREWKNDFKDFINELNLPRDDYREIMLYIDGVPEREWITCSKCARNANNDGLYPDGRTRCPIQEHYVLLEDGHCHLAEPYKPEKESS